MAGFQKSEQVILHENTSQILHICKFSGSNIWQIIVLITEY